MKNKFISIGMILLFVISISNSKIVYDGTLSGLQLWLFTVVPTLFPFMIISNLMFRYHVTDSLSNALAPVANKVLGISQYGAFTIIIGLLCGYPMGAKICSDFVKNNNLSVSEGNYLLTFINNASPGFITSYIAHALLFGQFETYKIAMIIYLPILVNAILFRPVKKNSNTTFSSYNQFNYTQSANSMLSVLYTLLEIGLYILIFSILCAFFKKIPISIIRLLLCGLSEITTGTFMISCCTLSFSLKLTLLLTCTSFGGICALCQSYAMIKDSGLSIKYYIYGKLVSCILCFILSILIL